MAKILFGMMMTDARGKLGGQVFSKNNAGAYVRTKVTPVNPRSSAQTGVRSIFAQISQAWSGLTASQIKGWNKAVDSWKRTDIFGNLKSTTGKALFQRINQNLLNSGQAILNNAPVPTENSLLRLVAANFDVNAPLYDVQVTGNEVGTVIQVQATPPLSEGTSFIKNRLRVIGYIAGSAATSLDVTALYTAKFGAVALGQNVHVAVRVINAVGQASVLESQRATILSI
jgi:hypothetical protein